MPRDCSTRRPGVRNARVRETLGLERVRCPILARLQHLEAGIDKRFLRDLADIRHLAVEPRAAALAAERDVPDGRSPFCRDKHRQDAQLRVRQTSEEFADADLRLHPGRRDDLGQSRSCGRSAR